MKKNLHRVVLFLLFGLTSYLSGEPDVNKRQVYRLKVYDELQLSVAGEPDLGKLLIINQKGEIFVPLIEKAILFVGLTPREAAEQVRQAYADGYLKAPVVDLKVSKYVQVSGQVVTPGAVRIPFHGKLDLATALINSGGVTDFANAESIKLMTAGEDNTTFTLAEVQGEKGKRLLNPGDQIIVTGNRIANMAVSMEGEIVEPGPVPIPKGGKLDLATAIVRSGGPSDDADLSKIELIPAAGGKSSFFSYAAILQGRSGKTLLKGGDRVLVWQSPFVNTGIFMVMEGALSKRGFMLFPLNGKLTLKSAITKAGLIAVANMKNVQVSRVGSKTVRYNMIALKSEVWLQPGDTIKVFEN